jgi:hypothetical protein
MKKKKCDFSQNCKNKALNTLTNYSKLTINHLRYLKSNSKELETPENYLILNRAGINVITSQHVMYLNRHICEQHRDELGIYWTRKNGLVLVLSMETPRQNQTLALMQWWAVKYGWGCSHWHCIAIGEGNLQNHTSYICIRSPDINRAPDKLRICVFYATKTSK